MGSFASYTQLCRLGRQTVTFCADQQQLPHISLRRPEAKLTSAAFLTRIGSTAMCAFPSLLFDSCGVFLRPWPLLLLCAP